MTTNSDRLHVTTIQGYTGQLHSHFCCFIVLSSLLILSLQHCCWSGCRLNNRQNSPESCEGVDDLSAHYVVFVVGWAEPRMSSMEVEQQVTFVRW